MRQGVTGGRRWRVRRLAEVIVPLAVVLTGASVESAGAAALPFVPPQVIDPDLGVLRNEQALQGSVAAGGRVVLVSDRDVSTVEGYVPEQVAVRRPDGTFGPLERVAPGTVLAGNAAGDAVLAVVDGDRLIARFLPRGEGSFRDPEVAAAGVSFPVSLGAVPWVGEDGTVVMAVNASDGSIGVRIRRPDGIWEARDGLVTGTAEVRVLPLAASVDPDGTLSLLWVEARTDARFGRSDSQAVVYGRAAAGAGLTREVVAAPPPVSSYAVRRGKPRFVALATGGRALVASMAVVRSRDPRQEIVVDIREPSGVWLASGRIAGQPVATRADLVETRLRVGVALGDDGTAVVAALYKAGITAFVRPAGAGRFGKPIPLEGADTIVAGGSPGVALGPAGQATAVWGAHAVPYGPKTRWQLETSSFSTGPEALEGGAWPVELLGVDGVTLARFGSCSSEGNCTYRLTATVRLRGAALLGLVVALCNPRCKDLDEIYVRGRDGSNRVTQKIVHFPPGRHRLTAFVFGPDRVIRRSRTFTVPG